MQRAIFFVSKENGKKKLPHVLVLSKFLICSLKFIENLKKNPAINFLIPSTRDKLKFRNALRNVRDIFRKIPPCKIQNHKLRLMSVKKFLRVFRENILEILAKKQAASFFSVEVSISQVRPSIHSRFVFFTKRLAGCKMERRNLQNIKGTQKIYIMDKNRLKIK